MLQVPRVQAIYDEFTSAEPFRRWRSPIILSVAVGIGYFLAARLSLALLSDPSGVAVFWPAAGVSSGVLICAGPIARLPVIAGVIGATIAANLLGDRNLWSSIVFAGCNAGEAALVAALLNRHFGSQFGLDSFGQVVGFLAAALLGAAVSGIGGMAGYLVFHPSTASASYIWFEWLASDAVGIITVAPLLVGLSAAMRHRPPPKEILEGLLISLLVVAMSAVTIYVPGHAGRIDANDFLVLFPLLVWASARCRPVFTALAILLAVLTIVWATTFSIGALGEQTRPIAERIFVARAAILALSIGGLIVAALFAERRIYEFALEHREGQLEIALEQAKSADRAKSSFLAAASHDLRQPLQTLKLWVATLQRQQRVVEQDNALTEIARSLQTMSSMLDNLLDINRLESGNLRPSLSEFPINNVFDALETDFRALTKEKGLEWRVVRSAACVHSDQHMLEQILRNLLSNAVRYTDKGKILIGCRRAGKAVRIEVWDSGVGIVGDQLSKIFEEHYQAKETVHLGGFGLGLAIVRRLGMILGHRVDVQSAPGKGSRFWVEVPLGQAQGDVSHESEGEAKAVDLPTKGTILVIEDESTVREALVSFLRSVGMNAVSAATANEALALVIDEGITPDLIMSDYNLPGSMNGVDSILALRQTLARDVPAIVLTGEARADVLRTVAQHDVSVATKPFEGNELLTLIRRLGTTL